MHPLRQYLKDVEEPIQDFARRVGASRQTLYRILGGSQAPKPALAKRIVEATGGAVSFESLYVQGEDIGEVVGLRPLEDAAVLDDDRLKVAIAMVVNHLAPLALEQAVEETTDIAAEAVINTYSALSTVTTRQGPARLRQALRPVLEEILRELSAPPPAAALDWGADLATQLYFEMQKLRYRSKLQP